LLVAAGIYRSLNRPVNAFDSIIDTELMKKYLKLFHRLDLPISKNRYNYRMVQQVKKPYSLKDIRAAGDLYADIAARLEAIATAAEAAKLKTVDLKLGTLTGSMFQRMLDSLDTVEANARTSIRKQSRD
jgi:hypothetical protein